MSTIEVLMVVECRSCDCAYPKSVNPVQISSCIQQLLFGSAEVSLNKWLLEGDVAMQLPATKVLSVQERQERVLPAVVVHFLGQERYRIIDVVVIGCF